MELDVDVEFNIFFFGFKCWVLFVRGLVCDFDILLFDELINYLDVDLISWLEEFFLCYGGMIFFVIYDCMFLKRLVSSIFEIDWGRFLSWVCDYEIFFVCKQVVFEVEESQQVVFDKKLVQEEIWICQGIKVRCIRNEGCVLVLEDMCKVWWEWCQVMGMVCMQIQEVECFGVFVIKVENVIYSYDIKLVVSGFFVVIMRGDKIGIIGFNGVGKIMLLWFLLGVLFF